MATYTVDASVFLNAFNPRESGHAKSQQFLARLQEGAYPIVVPTLLLPELAATIGRGHRDSALAIRFADAVSRIPHLVLVPVDSTLARQAMQVAADFRLRGSDAVYAAVALRFGCSLVTLDREQLERVAPVLTVRRPADALVELA
jgi:predicted nucleic acid-binding protein